MLDRVNFADGALGFRSPCLTDLGVPHLFTTRIGPGRNVSDFCVRAPGGLGAPFLRSALGIAAPVARARQVHGAHVLEVEPPGPAGDREADALVTSARDVVLMVYTADCVPIVVASADGRRVAAIHAGWRGLVAGVVPAALGHFEAPPAVGAIGACLSLERCEMGPEVAEEFIAAGLAEVVHAGRGDRSWVDVRGAARLQLERAGVRRIDVSGGCTWNDARLFHSHRRDVTHGSRDRAGSLGALVAIRR